MNMRIVAAGPTAQVFNQENLRKTYGGHLTLMAQAADAYPRRLRAASMLDLSELSSILLLRDYNTRLVVLSTILLGVNCGLMGSFCCCEREH